MSEPTLEFEYIEFDGERAALVTRPVIAETPWRLYVEQREWTTFMCSPIGLHQLALGFLLSEGVIGGLEDVWQLKVHLDENRVYMYFPDAGLDGELVLPSCPEAAGSIDVRLRQAAPARPKQRVLTSDCGGWHRLRRSSRRSVATPEQSTDHGGTRIQLDASAERISHAVSHQSRRSYRSPGR